MEKRALYILVVVAMSITTGRTEVAVAQDAAGGHLGLAVHSNCDTVPTQAPDTTPAWFRDDSSYTTGEPRHLKRVIGVVFREGTGQTERQTAIDSVGGRVLGGWRLNPVREGTYAVQVADGGSGDDVHLQQFIEKLRTLPQIKFAAPILTSTVNE